MEAGAQAPSFKLTGLDEPRDRSTIFWPRGPALLAFYKISCPVCQLTAPYLERLAANNAIQVIGISQDDAGATRGFMQRFGVTFPTLLDLSSEDYPASNAYGITSVPSLFLLERDGTIARAIQRILEARFRGDRRARRRFALRARRSCARMESRLRLQKLGPVWA